MNRVWIGLAFAACSRPAEPPKPVANQAPAESPCERLLTHLVDLEFAAAGGGSAAQKRTVVEAKQAEFMTACSKMEPARVSCALAATDLDRVTKCDAN